MLLRSRYVFIEIVISNVKFNDYIEQPENETAPISSSVTPASPDINHSSFRAPESRALTPLSDCSEPEEPEAVTLSSLTAVHPESTAPTIPPNAAVRPDKRKHADNTAGDENETGGNNGAVQAEVPRPKKKAKAKAAGATAVRRSGRGVRGEVQAAAA